jgi:oligosaccharyltransferase complex subunit alpha (ribophorin I)
MVDLQRKESDLKRLMEDAITLAQKVVDGKMNKQSYVESDEANAAKREKLSQEIESIQESL